MVNSLIAYDEVSERITQSPKVQTRLFSGFWLTFLCMSIIGHELTFRLTLYYLLYSKTVNKKGDKQICDNCEGEAPLK